MSAAQAQQATAMDPRGGARSFHAIPTASTRLIAHGSDGASQLLSSSPSRSPASNPPTSLQSSHSLHQAQVAGPSQPRESSSIHPGRTASEYESYASFFDGFASQKSHGSDNYHAQNSDIGDTTSRAGTFSLFGSDEEEDLKDLRAFSFTTSIRMNLEALSRRGADHYAYNADGYEDPNLHYGAKSVEDTHDGGWMQSSYAQLISQLSNTQVGAGHNTHDVELSPDARYCEGEHRYHQSQAYQGSLTQRTDSSKDTPPTASLASGRSSSDANDDDLRTPPEPSYDAFEPSIESTNYQPGSSHLDHRSPLYVQQARPSASHSSALPLASQAASDAGTQAPQLGSPFQPSQRQAQQSTQSLQRQELQQALSRYQISDDSELELLSDDVQAQRRAAGKARMMPGQQNESYSASAVSSPPESSLGHARRRSSNLAGFDASKPFTRLGPRDIAFSAANLPERRLTAVDCVDIIVSRHPSLCDAPLREFGEDGQPLPPTKKQETSDEERAARKKALNVKFCAKQRLSLIKAMVLMESRSASWKRIGPYNAANANIVNGVDPTDASSALSHGAQGVARLPPVPSPWSIDIRHEQLDVAQIKGKSKKTIELASLRTNALCTKCEGSKLGACLTCKAEQADECFWCSGTGREKTRAQAWCRRCQGAGVLKCNTCHGSLKSDCRSCEGTGTGEYGFFVDVTVKRVEMPAVPLATLFPQLDSASPSLQPGYDEVKTAATLALWDSITKLAEARHHAVATKGGKAKSKEAVPVMAACVWENSTSHIVSIDVPLAAKFKKGATPALRPEGLHRKIPTQRRFFTVPNDADLCSVELSEDEVKKFVHDSIGDNGIGGYGRSSSTSPDSRASPRYALGSPYGSSTASPATSMSGTSSSSASLATPDDGAAMSGYSTPSRVPSPRSDMPVAKPAAKEFVHRPSPLSQLAAATPAASSFSVQTDAVRLDGNSSNSSPRSSPERSPEDRSGSKLRRPSAGQILSKKLSSNILNKLSAHRGSV